MAYKTLALGTLLTTSSTTVYTVPGNTTVAVYGCVLTNNSTSQTQVDVYLNNGSTDFLVKRVVIPLGIGNSVTVPEMSQALSAGYSIKLDPAASNSFNYLITGDEQ